MPLKLKSRTQMPPDGIQYRQPESGWTYVGWDFEDGAQQILAHRQANPQLRLSTNIEQIRNELDAQNAARVAAIPDAAPYYLIEGDIPIPKLQPTVSLRVKQLAVGAKTIVDWLKSGAEAVSHELANKRAAVCVSCPLNNSKDITSFFTAPVSAAIQAALNQRKDWKLETDYDDKLNVCSGCLCPMKLKVHMPLAAILERLPEDAKAALDPRCWILKLDK